MLQLSSPEKPFGILLKMKPVRPNFMFCGNRKLGVWCLLGSTIKRRMVTTFKVKVGELIMLHPDCNVTGHEESLNASYKCKISIPQTHRLFTTISQQ
jgi:hypothetical protein